MKTRLVTLASAALLGALAGASGCTVENRASVQTQAICTPTADCTFSATCDAQYIGYMTLDKGASPNDVVWLTLQMANNLPNNEDLAVGRVNTNDAHIDETSVEYEGAMGGEQVYGSNFLVPAAGTSVISAQLNLTAAVGGTVAAPAEVLAHLRFRGYLDDGTRFETGDFPISVRVCTAGCAPLACGGFPTCPPASEGQLPLTCIQ